MIIAIASPIDISIFSPFTNTEEDKYILTENAKFNSAPAVNNLVLQFIENRHKIIIFTLAKSNFELNFNNIQIFGIKEYNTYPFKYLYGEFINSKNIQTTISKNIKIFDIIHSHWTYAYSYASIKFRKNVPICITIRDLSTVIFWYETLKNKITWLSKCFINHKVLKAKNIQFISNSAYTQKYLLNTRKIKSIIIPNPINKIFLNTPKNTKPKNHHIICVSSSNDKRKNIKTLLIAFQKINKIYPDSKLTIIGEPFTNKNPEIKIWDREKLLDNVNLLGKINHRKLPEILDTAEIFISPSLEETFGNTIIEAMSRGINIIAGQNSGAIPYILEFGKRGYLCDVTKSEEITKQIDYLFKNKIELKSIAQDNIKYLEENYSQEIIYKKHIVIYEETILKHKRNEL